MADAACMFSVTLAHLDAQNWFKGIRFYKDYTETALLSPPHPPPPLHHLWASPPPRVSVFGDEWSQRGSSLLTGSSWFNTTHPLIPILVLDPLFVTDTDEISSFAFLFCKMTRSVSACRSCHFQPHSRSQKTQSQRQIQSLKKYESLRNIRIKMDQKKKKSQELSAERFCGSLSLWWTSFGSGRTWLRAATAQNVFSSDVTQADRRAPLSAQRQHPLGSL